MAWEIPGLLARVPQCRWQGLLDTDFVQIGLLELAVVVVEERVHCLWAGIAFAQSAGSRLNHERVAVDL